MAASLSPARARRTIYLLSFVVLLLLLPCHSTVAAEAQDSSPPPPPPSRLASAATTPTPATTTAPSIPPLPRAEELCSLAKQYAVPLKLCSSEGGFGTIEIDRISLLAAVAAVGAPVAASPPPPLPPPEQQRQFPTSSKEPTPANAAAAAAAAAAALKQPSTPPEPAPQSLDALRQQLDRATIQAASYLAPPLPGIGGGPGAAALAAAAERRNAEFKSPKTRGGLIGAAVSVTVVSVLLVVLAGKKQKTGKWF